MGIDHGAGRKRLDQLSGRLLLRSL